WAAPAPVRCPRRPGRPVTRPGPPGPARPGAPAARRRTGTPAAPRGAGARRGPRGRRPSGHRRAGDEPFAVGVGAARAARDPVDLLDRAVPALARDQVGQVRRVPSHAREPARTPGVLPRQAEEVQAGAPGDAALV